MFCFFLLLHTGQQHLSATDLNLSKKFIFWVAIESQVDKRKSIICPAAKSIINSFCAPMSPCITDRLEFMQPRSQKILTTNLILLLPHEF